MPDQKYTFAHTDRIFYHTDRRTAELLRDLKQHDPSAYAAVFAKARADGRIDAGVAPSVRDEHVPGAFAKRANEIRLHIDADTKSTPQGSTAQRVTVDSPAAPTRAAYVPIARRGAEPSVGD